MPGYSGEPFSRRVVGRSMDKRTKKALVIRALMMAIKLIKPAPGLIHHSDRGGQYASHAYQKYLRQHRIVASLRQAKAIAQCASGTVLQPPETGMDWRSAIPTPAASDCRCLGIPGSVLQLKASAFDARLQNTNEIVKTTLGTCPKFVSTTR